MKMNLLRPRLTEPQLFGWRSFRRRFSFDQILRLRDDRRLQWRHWLWWRQRLSRTNGVRVDGAERDATRWRRGRKFGRIVSNFLFDWREIFEADDHRLFVDVLHVHVDVDVGFLRIRNLKDVQVGREHWPGGVRAGLIGKSETLGIILRF